MKTIGKNTLGLVPILCVVLLVVTAFSCEDNLQAPIGCGSNMQVIQSPVPFEFKFSLLNEQGLPTTTFAEGENLIFSFLITNNSNETWHLRSFYSEDFFRVYKIDNAETEALLDLGQPHKGMFCDKIGGIEVKPSGTIKFETPWAVPEFYYPTGLLFCLGQNAKPLKRGRYRTSFSIPFYFFEGDNSFETDTLKFCIDFIIN